MNRPLPPVVDPGPAGPPVVRALGRDRPLRREGPVAVGGRQGGTGQWKVENGYHGSRGQDGARSGRRKGSATVSSTSNGRRPSCVTGEGQERGNSGVFLMDTYEVQVLDCYENQTYADGKAAAIYGQYPPLVNACRKPGEWQTYDIVFHRPRFDADGKLLEPARMTVFHNGILVHDNDVLTGPTAHKARPPYKAHADRLPISLQDHGNPVRYRNIWIRDLE